MDADLGRFNTIHDLLRNLEKDPDRNAADMDAWDDYHTLVIETRAQCKRLETLKDISGRIPALDMAIHHMVAQKTKLPLKDFPAGMEAINKASNAISLLLIRSTIPPDHFLHARSRDLCNRVMDLGAVDTVPPTVPDSKEFSAERVKKKGTFRLPKMDIPKFDGQLKNWPHWWTDFKHAVHDNEELENRDKLAYLIKSITDPALQDYLHSGADTMDTYPEMLEVLQQRFDQPRELHSIHCGTIADLPPAKHTTADLCQLADTVFAAVTGIFRQGQVAIQHVATSLAVSSLPQILRTEWETKTETVKEVPDVFDLIKFIRRKAVNASKE